MEEWHIRPMLNRGESSAEYGVRIAGLRTGLAELRNPRSAMGYAFSQADSIRRLLYSDSWKVKFRTDFALPKLRL